VTHKEEELERVRKELKFWQGQSNYYNKWAEEMQKQLSQEKTLITHAQTETAHCLAACRRDKHFYKCDSVSSANWPMNEANSAQIGVFQEPNTCNWQATGA